MQPFTCKTLLQKKKKVNKICVLGLSCLMGRSFSLFHFINSKHGLGAYYRCPLPLTPPPPKENSLHFGGGALMQKVKQTPFKRFQDFFFFKDATVGLFCCL